MEAEYTLDIDSIPYSHVRDPQSTELLPCWSWIFRRNTVRHDPLHNSFMVLHSSTVDSGWLCLWLEEGPAPSACSSESDSET